MHIRDRLRLAFLQRRASQVCWRCAFPDPRLDGDAAPTELELLQGNTQHGLLSKPSYDEAPDPTSQERVPHNRRLQLVHRRDDPKRLPISKPIACGPFGDSLDCTGGSSTKAKSKRTLDASFQKKVSRIQRVQLIYKEDNPKHPWKLVPDGEWTLATPRKITHASKARTTSREGSASYSKTSLKSSPSRRRQRRLSRAFTDADSRTQDDLLVENSRRHRAIASGVKRTSGEPSRPNKNSNQGTQALVTKMPIGIPPDTAPLYATIDKPIYQGPNYHRYYVFRGLYGNVIRVEYSVPPHRKYLDEPREAQAETNTSIEHDGQALEEAEELFQKWLGISASVPQLVSPRNPVAKQDLDSTIRTDKPVRSSAQATFASEQPLLSPSNDHHRPHSLSAAHHTQPGYPSPGQSTIWPAIHDLSLNTANVPRSKGTLGKATWRPASATQGFPHGDLVAPSRAQAARLHTNTVCMCASSHLI